MKPVRPSIAIFLVFALMHAAHAQTDSAPVVVRVGGEGGFKLPSKSDTAPQQRANRAIVEAFERSHPNIRLVSAQGLQLGGPAAESSLLMQFAGGTGPDVVYVNFRSSATYINKGFLIPLDDYVRRDPDVIARLNPMVRHVLTDVGSGHYYSIPYAQFVQALYYRRDLFTAAGLDPDHPPTTWDQFYNDAKKLTDQPKGIWGFEFNNDPDASAYWWINFLWQAGGEVVKKNAAGQWVAAFNTPAGVTALEFYSKLFSAPWVGPDGKTYIGVATHTSTPGPDRANGKCAMWFAYQSNVIANTADASVLNPSLVGIAPMPRGPTGITANELNAAMWGISSQIKDPRVREAAWQFVKFMASDEADRIRTKAFVEAGLGNTVNPLSLQKYGYADESTPESRAWLEANRTLFANGHPEPYGSNMNEIYILLGQPLGTIETNPHADPKRLLDESAREIDTKLTGYVPAPVMRERRAVAWAVFGVLTILLLIWAGFVARSWWNDRRRFQAINRNIGAPISWRSQAIAWLFMLPALASVVLWSYLPLARGLEMAFQDYQIVGPSHYVGLDNFIDVFHQPSFWYGFRNSLEFTAFTLTLGFFVPLFLAIGLSEIPVGTVFYRTLFYLPATTSAMVVALLWKWFEDGTPQGVFNSVIHVATLGHTAPINWLQDPHWAMFAVVLPGIWASAGPGSIIYLAALKGIPNEMYEAAELDGAGIWAKIVHITLPTLKPLIIINLVGATIGAFQAAQNILVMTGGGPAPYVTHTLGLEIFYNAFLYLKLGYATAAAWIMGVMLVGFTLFQLRIIRQLKFTTAKA